MDNLRLLTATLLDPAGDAPFSVIQLQDAQPPTQSFLPDIRSQGVPQEGSGVPLPGLSSPQFVGSSQGAVGGSEVLSVSEPQVVSVSQPESCAHHGHETFPPIWPWILVSSGIPQSGLPDIRTEGLLQDTSAAVGVPLQGLSSPQFVGSSQGAPGGSEVVSISEPQVVSVSQPESVFVSEPQQVFVEQPQAGQAFSGDVSAPQSNIQQAVLTNVVAGAPDLFTPQADGILVSGGIPLSQGNGIGPQGTVGILEDASFSSFSQGAAAAPDAGQPQATFVSQPASGGVPLPGLSSAPRDSGASQITQVFPSIGNLGSLSTGGVPLSAVVPQGNFASSQNFPPPPAFPAVEQAEAAPQAFGSGSIVQVPLSGAGSVGQDASIFPSNPGQSQVIPVSPVQFNSVSEPQLLQSFSSAAVQDAIGVPLAATSPQVKTPDMSALPLADTSSSSSSSPSFPPFSQDPLQVAPPSNVLLDSAAPDVIQEVPSPTLTNDFDLRVESAPQEPDQLYSPPATDTSLTDTSDVRAAAPASSAANTAKSLTQSQGASAVSGGQSAGPRFRPLVVRRKPEGGAPRRVRNFKPFDSDEAGFEYSAPGQRVQIVFGNRSPRTRFAASQRSGRARRGGSGKALSEVQPQRNNIGFVFPQRRDPILPSAPASTGEDLAHSLLTPELAPPH
nr:BRD4-interacting chromatin-remodeling complex-associated protein-like [Penaeus vannamei]